MNCIRPVLALGVVNLDSKIGDKIRAVVLNLQIERTSTGYLSRNTTLYQRLAALTFSGKLLRTADGYQLTGRH